MKLRLIAILMFLACSLIACATSTLAPTGAPPSGVLVLEKEITLTTDGQIALALRASAPGAAWNRLGAEAATISIHVDGAYKSDVVLFRGETAFTYETLVGELSAGKHRVAIYREPTKSASQATQVRVDEITARVFSRADPLYQVMAHAPILYGRDESRSSDTPLWMYHENTRDATTTTIQYTIIFSNEDGGTAADALMARWGRLTDIEWVYRVTLNANGEITREEFQDKDHNAAIFRGAKEGRHPFLKDVTRNNLFADTGASPYRFALVPTEALSDTAREEMMDQHPWMYRVMAEEWEREKQSLTERTADPDTRAVSDPRNYLYVEFKSNLASATCDAKLAFEAKLRGSDRWYSSDHGTDSLRIQSQGWRRGAIELPAGISGEQIEALRFVAYPGKNSPNCALTITDVRKAFLLNQDYAPTPSLLTWNGRQVLDADDTTPAPANFVLPIAK